MHRSFRGGNLGTTQRRTDASGGGVFAFTLLAMAGVLNVIWGAIGRDEAVFRG